MSMRKTILWPLLIVAGTSSGVAQTQANLTTTTSTRDAAVPAKTPYIDLYDPLLDLPPLPRAKVALIGGTVTQVDHVSNRLTLRPFGSKQQLRVDFDMRSAVYRDSQPALPKDIQRGDRVYVDTMLNGTRVFAKSVRIQTGASSGNGTGQVIDYDAAANLLTVRDELSSQPVHFRLSSTTVVRNGTQTIQAAELRPGSLVSLTFVDQQGHSVVRDVTLLAQPGAEFSFFGKLTFVDLSQKMMAIANQVDGKTYEIHLASIPPAVLRNLHEGSDVGVSAVFDGTQYTARSVASAAQSSEQQ